MCDPLVIHWPAGHRGPGRGAPPVPPLHRHRPDHPRLLRRRDARRRRRRRADAAAGRVDALLVRRRRRAHREGDAVLRDARHPGHLAPGVEGRRPSTVRCRWTAASSTRTAGSCSTPTRTASEAHDLADQHPDKVEELKALWFAEAEKYDVLPLNDLRDRRVPQTSSSHIGRARRAASTRTTRAPARCPSARPPTPQRLVQDAGRGRVHRPTSQGVIFAQGSRFGGHSLFVKDGKLTYAYNFLGIPPEQRLVGRRPRRRAPTSSASSSPRSAWASTTSPSGRCKLYVDDEVVAEGEIRTIDRPLLAVRRGPVHRLRRRRRGVSEYRPPVRVHRRRDREGRVRRRRRRLRRRRGATWPRRWPGTEVLARVRSHPRHPPRT